MSYLYLLPWEWCRDRWRAPGGNALGSLDLRNESQMETPGGFSGYGVFSYAKPREAIAGFSLGTDLQRSLTRFERDGIRTTLGLSTFTSPTVLAGLWDLLTEHADPSGVSGPKPLRGRLGETVDLRLRGFPTIHAKFSRTDQTRAVSVFRADYERNRPRTPIEVLRKWTGQTMRDLFGEMDDDVACEILPARFRADGWAIPATMVSDNFNRANGELGANWTDDAGDADVVTNAWQLNTGDALSRWIGTSLSTDNHYAQVLGLNRIAGGSNQGSGPICRKAASATLTYYAALMGTSADNNFYLYKRVAGTYTQLDIFAVNANATWKVEANGSTIKGYQDGIERNSATDTAITGNLPTGIFGSGFAQRNDDFEAADLTAALQPNMFLTF